MTISGQPFVSDQQERPAVADKPARRLRKVCTVYVRAVGWVVSCIAIACLSIACLYGLLLASYIVNVSVKCVALEILAF